MMRVYARFYRFLKLDTTNIDSLVAVPAATSDVLTLAVTVDTGITSAYASNLITGTSVYYTVGVQLSSNRNMNMDIGTLTSTTGDGVLLKAVSTNT
jgi:hypothetical protein